MFYLLLEKHRNRQTACFVDARSGQLVRKANLKAIILLRRYPREIDLEESYRDHRSRGGEHLGFGRPVNAVRQVPVWRAA